MKKVIFTLSCIIIIISGCKTYTVSHDNLYTNHEDIYGSACRNPTYIATMGVYAIIQNDSSNYSQEKLTMYNLLLVAQKKYGEDVTIQNVRWDKKNKTNISAIFDVIKCK